MSSKDNTTPTLSHRRAKSHDVRSTTTAVEGPRPSLLGSVPSHPRVFGLGLGFESATELGDPAAAQAAPVTSTGEQPILGTDTEGPGEGVVSVSPAGWSQVSNPPPTMATGAPLPPIIKGVTSSDPASLEAAAATSPQPPVSKVATQGPGGSTAVRSRNAAATSSSVFFGGQTRTAVVREDQDRVDHHSTTAVPRPPQLLPGFVSPRRRRDAHIQTGTQAGPSSNAGRRPVTPVHQVIPTYDQRREAEDAWLRREELHRREWERQQRLGSEQLGAAHFHAGAAARRQPFVVAGPRASIAPAAAANAGPAFLGRPRGNSQASAVEQASAFGNVVPGPSHRARFVSVPAGGYGAVDDHQVHIRSPRTAVASYADSPGHGPFPGASRLETEGAYTKNPSPSTPEGMTREMYEMMCAFSEDVRQEQEQEEDVEEEDDEGSAAAAAAAEAASFRMPMPGINQHGHLKLPRGLTRAEFEAEQSQLMADAQAFSELVGAEEEEVAAAAAQEAEDRRRDAMGHRQPCVSSPGAASVSTYYGTGTLDAETWQQAEDELWDVLNRRRVPSYDERGALVFPTSPTAAEIERERAAIFKRARRQAEEAVGASQGAGWGGEGSVNRNPQIPFGIPEDLYDQACAFSEQVRQEEAERELVSSGQPGPSHPSPLPAPLACPGLIQWGVTEGGLISAWRAHVAQQPAESRFPPVAGSGIEQHRAPPPVHHHDPFDDRDVAAISRSTAAARSGLFLGRSARSSARNATRGSYHPAEISTGSPRPRGRGVVVGEYVAPPEQATPLPARRRAVRTPSPSVYSRTSGFGTGQAAVQRPVTGGGVSGSDRDDVFGSPLGPVAAGIQRRNLASLSERVNSGSDRGDEVSLREGQVGKGKMVVRNGSAARASSSSLSDGGNHASRWVYESPSIGKMDSGPPRDKGKRKATASEVAAQVAEEKLLMGTSASPAASEVESEGGEEGEGEGVIRPPTPSPAVSLSSTLLNDSGSRDELPLPLSPTPTAPPPPPSSAAAPTAVPLLAGSHRTLDLDEGFEYDAGIEPAKSTRRKKVTGGLRGLARGIKDALTLASSRRAAAAGRPPPEQAAAVATPRPEIMDREANQSTATDLNVGERPRLFASLAGRFTPRPGSSASAHRAQRVQVGGTGSLGSRRWPARRSSLARALSIPNLRSSPSFTADTLNKPLPQTPLFVVRETASGDEASTPDDGASVESVGLPVAVVVEGQSLRRGRNVSFAELPPSTTRWLRSSGSAPEIVPRTSVEEPTPVRAQQQQRILELSAALQHAESTAAAAEARASAAYLELTRLHAELDVYVAEATVAQRALTAARVEFQVQLDAARRETERHAAETERQHARHLDYLRVLADGHLAERQGLEAQIAMLYSAVGGLQTQLLYAGVAVPQGGAARGARQSLQFPAAAEAAQQEEGTAANQPPQPPSPEFVYLGPRHRFGSRLPEPGLFQILPHPIPLPPQQPPFAPSESVRLANRAGRLAAETGGPEYRQRVRRRQVPDSD
ncbi:hypothetical protein VF21_03894 [Pseudogymnoascus sp. 05NY08]|nr:hypothetical protein VF21_03894 [Pseudogymnoascus sp. 05NY08]